MCLNAVWETSGAGTSDAPGAYQTAKDWWDRCPADRKHIGDRNPPAGALLRFSNGNADGHICYSLGGEQAASTDKPSAGLTGTTTITDIEHSWGGRHYEGWTDWLGGWDVITAEGEDDMAVADDIAWINAGEGNPASLAALGAKLDALRADVNYIHQVSPYSLKAIRETDGAVNLTADQAAALSKQLTDAVTTNLTSALAADKDAVLTAIKQLPDAVRAELAAALK
jgi:hypothetical protein